MEDENMSETRPEAMLDENAWTRLLGDIHEGGIVPVVGPELLEVEIDGETVNFRVHLAEYLARRLGVSPEGLSLNHPLWEVLHRYRHERSGVANPDEPYKIVHTFLRDEWSSIPVPRPLRLLAEIKPFWIFLAAFWEPFLLQALDKIRQYPVNAIVNRLQKVESTPRGRNRSEISPWCEVNDLETVSEIEADTVFQMVGLPAGRAGCFALSEEDALLFNLKAMTTHSKRPQFNQALSDKHFLVLGCNLPDWLARFVVAGQAEKSDGTCIIPVSLVVDRETGSDDPLTAFYRRINARVFRGGSAVEFVSQLHERWQERLQRADQTGPEEEQEPFEEGSLFISYAHEDEVAALELSRRLRQAKIKVWLDKRGLDIGDAYEQKIYYNISISTLFLPVLSRTSLEGDEERFYRLEWGRACQLAKERRDGIGFGKFIIPVKVDDVGYDCTGLPEEFGVHWANAPGGIPDTEMIDGLRKLIMAYNRHRKGKRSADYGW